MSPRIAQAIFLALVAASILAAFYVATSFWSTSRSISENTPSVIVDSTDYGFLVLTVFIPMALLQWIGIRENKRFIKRYGSAILIGWLITSVVVAFGLSRFIQSELRAEGYQECAAFFVNDVGQRFGKRKLWGLSAEHC